MYQVHRLPSYDNPPVIEVVASVQFDPLPSFNAVHPGLLWRRFRDRLPRVEQKPTLPPVVERLGVRAPLNQVQFQVTDGVEIPRVWFINEAGDELVQVQPDRFIRNWRAVPQLGRPYPRYEEHIRPRFVDDFALFLGFAREDVGAEIEPNQCEITYINHIRPNQHWSTHADLGSVFRGWNSAYAQLVESPLEVIHLKMAHMLNDDSGNFLGRLHVTVQSAFTTSSAGSESDEPIFSANAHCAGQTYEFR